MAAEDSGQLGSPAKAWYSFGKSTETPQGTLLIPAVEETPETDEFSLTPPLAAQDVKAVPEIPESPVLGCRSRNSSFASDVNSSRGILAKSADLVNSAIGACEGRMTTFLEREIATIHRDVDALSSMGVRIDALHSSLETLQEIVEKIVTKVAASPQQLDEASIYTVLEQERHKVEYYTRLTESNNVAFATLRSDHDALSQVVRKSPQIDVNAMLEIERIEREALGASLRRDLDEISSKLESHSKLFIPRTASSQVDSSQFHAREASMVSVVVSQIEECTYTKTQIDALLEPERLAQAAADADLRTGVESLPALRADVESLNFKVLSSQANESHSKDLLDQERQMRQALEGRILGLLEQSKLQHDNDVSATRELVKALSSQTQSSGATGQTTEMRTLLQQEQQARMNLSKNVEALSWEVQKITGDGRTELREQQQNARDVFEARIISELQQQKLEHGSSIAALQKDVETLSIDLKPLSAAKSMDDRIHVIYAALQKDVDTLSSEVKNIMASKVTDEARINTLSEQEQSARNCLQLSEERLATVVEQEKHARDAHETRISVRFVKLEQDQLSNASRFADLKNELDTLTSTVKSISTVPRQLDAARVSALLEQEQHARSCLHLSEERFSKIVDEAQLAQKAYEMRMNALIEKEQQDQRINFTALHKDVDDLSAAVKTLPDPSQIAALRKEVDSLSTTIKSNISAKQSGEVHMKSEGGQQQLELISRLETRVQDLQSSQDLLYKDLAALNTPQKQETVSRLEKNIEEIWLAMHAAQKQETSVRDGIRCSNGKEDEWNGNGARFRRLERKVEELVKLEGSMKELRNDVAKRSLCTSHDSSASTASTTLPEFGSEEKAVPPTLLEAVRQQVNILEGRILEVVQRKMSVLESGMRDAQSGVEKELGKTAVRVEEHLGKMMLEFQRLDGVVADMSEEHARVDHAMKENVSNMAVRLQHLQDSLKSSPSSTAPDMSMVAPDSRRQSLSFTRRPASPTPLCRSGWMSPPPPRQHIADDHSSAQSSVTAPPSEAGQHAANQHKPLCRSGWMSPPQPGAMRIDDPSGASTSASESGPVQSQLTPRGRTTVIVNGPSQGAVVNGPSQGLSAGARVRLNALVEMTQGQQDSGQVTSSSNQGVPSKDLPSAPRIGRRDPKSWITPNHSPRWARQIEGIAEQP